MSANPSIFACNTYSYTISHDARNCLSHLADLGFSDVELMMYPGHLWPPDTDTAMRRELLRLVQAKALHIVTLNMPNIDMNVAGASPEMRQYTIELLKGIIELAADLEVPGIVIGPGKANPLFPAPKERLIGYLFAALDKLVPLAAAAGTALWVENIPFAFLPAIDELVAVLDRYGCAAIGITYDAANAHFIGEDIGHGLRLCGDRLRLVHLSDTDRRTYRHDAIGRGTVPFETIPPLLDAVGYRRRPVLEIISPNADRDILKGADRLAALGFGRARPADTDRANQSGRT